MTQQEKSKICEKVGEYFLRVVKNHNYYLNFKAAFLKENGINPKLLQFDRHHIYMKAIAKFSAMADREYSEHRHEDSAYEYITIFINLILRQYLEAPRIVDPRRLGMVGQELFDLSCYGVFGDKYLEDMERMNQQKGNMRAPRNDKEAWLMAEYEMRLRNGEKLDFETFMRDANVPDDEFWNRRANREYGHRDEYNDRDDNLYNDDDWEDLMEDDNTPW